MIGRISRVYIRDVWSREIEFSNFLADNLDILGDILNIELGNPEREKSTGNFSVDIVAEDSSGNTIVIENQFGKSDHDHLGKIITYLASVDARAAVWVVEDPRPEHIEAINLLNKSSSADFFMVKIEPISIGDSAPAPLLTLIVGPSEEMRIIGAEQQKRKERDIQRREFWSRMLEKIKNRSDIRMFSGSSPTYSPYIQQGAGMSGLHYNFVIGGNTARVEFRMEGQDWENNRRNYKILYDEKESIESQFGEPLIWDFVETRKAQIVRKDVGGFDLENPDEWDEIQNAMIDAMIRLEKTINPYLQKFE